MSIQDLSRPRYSYFVPLFALILAGCAPLQIGYYLTPENYPGYYAPAAAEPIPVTATYLLDDPVTATPVSTLRGLETNTPLPTMTPTATPTITPTPFTCTETRGTMIFESFISSFTGGEFRYRVYLPPCYAVSERRYPVLYILHGLGTSMDDSQWDKMGLDDEAGQSYLSGTLAPMIIVMPNGTDAYHGNSTGNYPDLLVEELLPRIEAQYCTWNEPAGRAIGGLSRGGYWAYWIAFSHPELFSKVGGHSPYFFEPSSPAEKNPSRLVDTAPGLEGLAMYFDHGPNDYPEVLLGVADFVDRLARRGLPSRYVINPTGGHTEEYWSAHVPEYLAFYATGWPVDPGELPSCHEPSPATPAAGG